MNETSCSSTLHGVRVAECCSVLQRIAVCCNVWLCVMNHARFTIHVIVGALYRAPPFIGLPPKSFHMHRLLL